MAVQELLVRLGLDDSSFSKKMQGINKEISILDKNFDGAINEFKEFDKTQAGLAKKTEYLSDKLELLGGATKLAQQRMAELTQENKENEQALANFGKKLEIVNRELGKNSEELSQAQQQYKQVSSSVNNLKGIEKVFDEANASIEKNNQKIKESEKNYKALDKSIDVNKASIERLKNENLQLDEKIRRVSTSLNLNEKEMINLANQYSKTEAKVAKIATQYDKVSKKYGENSAEAKKLKAELDKYNATAEKQKTMLQSLPSDVSKLSLAYGQNVKKIEQLELTNKNMVKAQSALQKQMASSRAEITKQENAYKEAQNQLKRYGVESDSLEKSLKQVKVLLAQESSALKETGGNVKFLTERIDALQKEQKSLEQQYDKTQRAMQRTSKEMQNTEEKIAGLVANTKKLNNQLKETQIDKLFTGLNGKAKQLESLGTAMTGIGDNIRNVGQTLTFGLSMPVAMFGKTAMSTFLGFEERVRKVNAVFGGASGEMGTQFDYLSEQSRHYGRTTEWTATQVGEAYEYMAMAGWNVEKSTASMSKLLSLASIGMIDLGLATDIITDTMTPFSDELKRLGEEAKASGKEFDDTAYMVDIFAQTIRKSNTSIPLLGETMKYSASVTAEAGASFEDMATSIGLMANSGIKGSMAGTSLAQGITRLLAPTDKAIGVMEEFGITVAKNEQGGMDLEGSIKNLQVAFSGMSKQTQVANAKIIFGQTALKGWLPLITASAEEYDTLANSIKNADGATEEMMTEIEKSSAYTFKIMQSAIQDMLIVIGDALAPAMKEIGEAIGNMATKLSDWVTKMKDTNPELLSLIGKLGLLAVIVPPLIMLFGVFTGGMGRLFTGTSTAIKGFTKFSKEVLEVKNGVTRAEGSVGILAKSMGGLLTTFGTATVAITAGVGAILAIATAVGTSEKSISMLMDKFGILGTFISGTCEFIAGIVQATFGNAITWIAGAGKAIGAILTGKWWQIDDILFETFNKVEINTAQSWSNIKMETTRGISKLKDITKEGSIDIVNTYTTTIEGMKGVTVDTADEVGKTFAQKFKDLDKDTLTILRGTSDQMGLIFNGIKEDMDISKAEKKFTDNIINLVKSGKFNLKELETEFAEATAMMETHMKDGSIRIRKAGEDIVKEFGKIGQMSTNEVLMNVAQMVKGLDAETFNSVKKMGGHWTKLFEEVNDVSTISLANLMEAMRRKVGELKFDTPEGLAILQKEIEGAFDSTFGVVETTVDEATTHVSDAFTTMVGAIKDNSVEGIEGVAEVFATGLATLDVETVKSLRDTSNNWYSILDGTVTENGELIDNFAQQILWNLGWVSEQSPEKLEGFKDGLLEALVEANLITEGEMATIVQTIEEQTQEAVEASEETGEKVKENMIPKGGAEALREQLDKVSGTFTEKTQEIAEASGKAGEEAQKKFDESVSNVGKDIQLDENIINVEHLNTQFQNAGTLALQAFVTGWSTNINLITEAINLALTTVTTDLSTPLSVLDVAFETIVIKAGLLNDTLGFTTEKINSINSVGFTPVEGGIDNIKAKMGEFNTNTIDSKNNLNEMVNLTAGSLAGSISDANGKTKELKGSVKGATEEVVKLSNKSLSAIGTQADNFKVKIDKVKESLINLLKELDKVIDKKFTKLDTELNGISLRITTATSYVGDLRNSLSTLDTLTFYNLISRLQDVVYWLSSVSNKANSATYAVNNVPSRPRMIEQNDIATLGETYFTQMSARTRFDITKYQTRGSYYNSSSLAGTGANAIEVQHQREQLSLMQQQNELLKQLLMATMNVGGNINLSVDLDGRQVAKASAPYMATEINTINKRKMRLGGQGY